MATDWNPIDTLTPSAAWVGVKDSDGQEFFAAATRGGWITAANPAGRKPVAWRTLASGETVPDRFKCFVAGQVESPGFLSRLLRPRRPDKSGFLGSYPSWDAAAIEATPPYLVTTDHHGDPELVTSREQQILSAFLLSGAPRDARVLDFGGGAGYYFATLAKAGPVSWTVVEIPEIVEANKGRSDVRFATEIPPEPFDFVLASGVIQCLDNPYDALDRLLSTGAPVCLNRIPLAAIEDDVITLHHHHDVRSPTWVFSRLRFATEVARRASIVARWDVAEDRGAPGPKGLRFEGLLLRSE